MQMLGFTHAAKSMYFGADMPFKFLEKKHGVGPDFLTKVSVCSVINVFGYNTLLNLNCLVVI